MTSRRVRLSRFLLFPLTLTLGVLAMGAPVALAANGGNSANAKLCQKGGWENLVRADQTPFANQGACVSYSASGGRFGQTITFTSTVPSPGHVGDNYTPTANATSGLPVAFGSGTAAVCTVAGGSVTFIAQGTCVINANQAGNATWSSAAQVQQSITVIRISPVINSVAPTSATEDTLYTYNAAMSGPGGSGATWSTVSPTDTCGGSINSGTGVYTFTPTGPNPPASCVVAIKVCDAGLTCSATQASTVTITADNDAPVISNSPPTTATEDTFYSHDANAAPSDGPTETWSTLAGANNSCGGTIDSSTGVYTFVPTGPNPPANCKVGIQLCDGTTVTTQCTTQVATVTITPVIRMPQSITFTSTIPSPGYVGDSYAATATATSGLTVTLSSGTPTVCTISGGSVNFIAQGTCVINADQAGNANWLPAPQVQQSITVNRKPQTISFTSTPPSPGYVGDRYAATATATSGLPIVFTSVTNTVCIISGGSVIFIAQGVCVINANQAGNATWLPAPQVQQSITVVVGP